MYSFDQDIANDIAKRPMKYWLMKILFESNEAEAEEIEDLIWKDVLRKYSTNVARAVMTSLTLLLEHEAITKYINRFKRYELKMALPEILSPIEGAYLARGDIISMSDVEFNQTIETLSHYQKILSRIKTKRGLPLSIPFEVEKQLFDKINKATVRRILDKWTGYYIMIS